MLIYLATNDRSTFGILWKAYLSAHHSSRPEKVLDQLTGQASVILFHVCVKNPHWEVVRHHSL